MYRRIAKEILSRGTEAQPGGGGPEPGAPPLPNLRALLHKVVLSMRQGGDDCSEGKKTWWGIKTSQKFVKRCQNISMWVNLSKVTD